MYPVLFKVGPFTFYTYGALVALAFIVGFSLIYREACRKNFYSDKILDLEVVILVSGIIGARFLHVAVNLDLYKDNLLSTLFVWQGGLAFYGGIITAIAASIIFLRIKKMPIIKTGDFLAPYLALGHAIGRLACFFNGCCYGKATDGKSFGIVFHVVDNVARHPVQLFSSLGLFGIFCILMILKRYRFFGGFLFSLYLLLYSMQRFCMDFLRGDNPTYLYNLTISQIISVAIFCISILMMLFLPKRGNARN